MKPLRYILFAVLFSLPAFGQGSAIPGVTGVAGPGNLMRVIPFAPMVVCGYPAGSGTPCTNYATTYNSPTLANSCPSNAPVVTPATTTCSGTSDKNGNFVIFVSAGAAYSYYFEASNQWYGPYVVTGSGGSSLNLGSPGPIGYVSPGSGYFSNLTVGQDRRSASLPLILTFATRLECSTPRAMRSRWR